MKTVMQEYQRLSKQSYKDLIDFVMSEKPGERSVEEIMNQWDAIRPNLTIDHIKKAIVKDLRERNQFSDEQIINFVWRNQRHSQLTANGHPDADPDYWMWYRDQIYTGIARLRVDQAETMLELEGLIEEQPTEEAREELRRKHLKIQVLLEELFDTLEEALES